MGSTSSSVHHHIQAAFILTTKNILCSITGCCWCRISLPPSPYWRVWTVKRWGCLCWLSPRAALDAKKLEVPDEQHLPGAEHLGNMPFTIVGDAAFPLKTYLMRPYPGLDLTRQQRIFNYRLSRARKVVENAFTFCQLAGESCMAGSTYTLTK